MRTTVLFLLSATMLAAAPGDCRIARLYLDQPDDAARLAGLDLDFVSEARSPVRDVVTTDEEIALIRGLGIRVEVVDSCAGPFAIPPEYHDLAETYRVFDSLQALYPDLVHTDTIGYSQWRTMPIRAVRISDHAAEEEDEPAVLFTGVTHAREPLGSEIIIHLAKYLCSNYASSPEVRRWVDSTEIWLVPIVNVDGFQFLFDSATVYPYWRKNQRDNNQNGRFDRNYDGVDLNRNFDWRWTYGGSTTPSSETYRGPYASSEGEVQAWCYLALRERPVFGISYHSYGSVVMYPWRYQGQTTPDEDVYQSVAQGLAQRIGYTVSITSGSNMSTDWLYACAGQLDFVIETGLDEFIPPAETIPLVCAMNFAGDTFLLNRLFYSGVTGHVCDSATGAPLVAEVQVLGRVDSGLAPRLTESRYGRYHRALIRGTYSLRFIAAGYETLTVSGINVGPDSLTHLDVRLRGTVGLADVAVPAGRAFDARPNPTRGIVVLHLAPRSLDPSVPLRVFDASGRLVLSSSLDISDSSFRLDLRAMPVGVYTARLGPASCRLVRTE